MSKCKYCGEEVYKHVDECQGCAQVRIRLRDMLALKANFLIAVDVIAAIKERGGPL